MQRCDDSERMQIVRVALSQSAITALTTRQHGAVGLNHEGAVLSAYYLQQQQPTNSGVNGSVTLGGGKLTQRERYPGGQKSHSGVHGRRHSRGSSGRIPQADTCFGNGCQLIFYGGQIANAYMSHCFLKRTHAAVLLIQDNRHT